MSEPISVISWPTLENGSTSSTASIAVGPALNTTPIPETLSPYTPEQEQQIGRDMLASGHATQAQVDEHFAQVAAKASNPNQISEKEIPKLEQRVVDPNQVTDLNQIFPPGKFEQFDLPKTVDLNAGKVIRNSLVTGEFTREIGSEIVREVDRVSKSYSTMNEAEKEIFQRSEQIKVQNMFGDKAWEKFKAANDLLKNIDAKNPGLIKFLQSNGGAASAAVIIRLAHQAEILAEKNKGKKNA